MDGVRGRGGFLLSVQIAYYNIIFLFNWFIFIYLYFIYLFI